MKRFALSLALAALVLAGVNATAPTALAWCGAGWPTQCKEAPADSGHPLLDGLMIALDVTRSLF